MCIGFHPLVHDFYNVYEILHLPEADAEELTRGCKLQDIGQQRPPEVNAEEFARAYKIPDIGPQSSANGKNLVFLYLESFEKTYFDENLFPGLAVELKKI
jgi:phosphoglycerol transferase